MLRIIVFTLMILFALPVLGQQLAENKGQSEKEKINWMSLEEAQERMQKEPRKIMVDVYTNWCGPCKMMMANTFTNQKIVSYINENYYAVKFNAEGPEPVTFKGKEFKNLNHDPNKRGRNSTHELTYAIANVNGRIAYPTIVYIDEDLNILTPVQGYHKPKQLEPILYFFAEDAYRDTEFSEYSQSFKSKL